VIYPGIVILLTVVARSGFVKHYDSVLVAGVKAKTMTSLLIIPALLAERFFVYQSDHTLKAFSFAIIPVWTRSLISDGNCSFCHFLSVSIGLSAFLTAFKAYNAAPNE